MRSTASQDDCRWTRTPRCAPQNPYATSKAACDLLAAQYADAQDLRVVRARAFNHAGPGQSDEYVVGTLTRQVAEAEARGDGEALLRTGNPDSKRDFTDVRDVVRAYAAAAQLESDAFNVCSGRAVSVRELLELLEAVARVPLRHELDPKRMRAHDVPEVRGSSQALHEATRLEAGDPARANCGRRAGPLAPPPRRGGRRLAWPRATRDARVEIQQPLRVAHLVVVCPRPRDQLVALRAAQLGALPERGHARGERGGVARRHAALGSEHLREASQGGRDHRHAGGHRLERRVGGELVVARGHQHHRRAGELAREARALETTR